MRLIARIALPAVLACLLAGSPALANPGVFGAAYATPAVPATIVATSSFQVSVSLTNTGDEPWTAAQRSYLGTLAREAGEELPDELTKRDAAKKIEELQVRTGRG